MREAHTQICSPWIHFFSSFCERNKGFRQGEENKEEMKRDLSSNLLPPLTKTQSLTVCFSSNYFKQSSVRNWSVLRVLAPHKPLGCMQWSSWGMESIGEHYRPGGAAGRRKSFSAENKPKQQPHVTWNKGYQGNSRQVFLSFSFSVKELPPPIVSRSKSPSWDLSWPSFMIFTLPDSGFAKCTQTETFFLSHVDVVFIAPTSETYTLPLSITNKHSRYREATQPSALFNPKPPWRSPSATPGCHHCLTFQSQACCWKTGI